MVFRGRFAAAFAAAVLVGVGCGGGSDSGGGPTGPALYCTDGGSAAPNTVNMGCGGKADTTTEKVAISIDGPASGATMTVRGVNFDITYDPAKLEYVDADPPGIASPLFPDGLVLAALANGQQGRVIVAIQQLGTLDDVTIGVGQHLPLVDLYFRRVPGANFDPTPLTFERTSATAASLPVTFTNGLALEYQ